jgi:hypothetical protein
MTTYLQIDKTENKTTHLTQEKNGNQECQGEESQ